MQIQPGDVFALAGIAAVFYAAGLAWSHHRQRKTDIKRESRKEPKVSDAARGIAVPGDMDGINLSSVSRSAPTRRPIGESAERRRSSVRETVQPLRASDDSARRRHDEELQRQSAFVVANDSSSSHSRHRNDPVCSPSYADSSSRSSSYSGGCSGGSSSSSSSSSSDSGSCSSSSD